jgi:hypothetical protein
VEVYLHSFLISALGEDKCTAAGTGRYNPRKTNQYPFRRKAGLDVLDKIRTPYHPAHNLVIILTAKPCNFRDGNMFMNVEKVRIGK